MKNLTVITFLQDEEAVTSKTKKHKTKEQNTNYMHST